MRSSGKKIKEKLPKNYKWKYQFATKNRIKGRTKGGIVSGIKREVVEEEREEEVEGIQERKIKIKKDTWRVIIIYNRDMLELKKKLKAIIKDQKVQKL